MVENKMQQAVFDTYKCRARATYIYPLNVAFRAYLVHILLPPTSPRLLSSGGLVKTTLAYQPFGYCSLVLRTNCLEFEWFVP